VPRNAVCDKGGFTTQLTSLAFGVVFAVSSAPLTAQTTQDRVNLDAVAIELDFVEPTVAVGHLLDRGGQRRLDEARVWTFGANRWRLLASEGHGSQQPRRQLAVRGSLGHKVNGQNKQDDKKRHSEGYVYGQSDSIVFYPPPPVWSFSLFGLRAPL
jgi:hypothetical protein